MAEALGSSGTSQIIDLQLLNNSDNNIAGYVIYDDGKPSRVVLLNYATDPSGASDYTAQIAIDGSGLGLPNASPPQIFVRRLTTPGNTTADHVPFYYGNQVRLFSLFFSHDVFCNWINVYLFCFIYRPSGRLYRQTAYFKGIK